MRTVITTEDDLNSLGPEWVVSTPVGPPMILSNLPRILTVADILAQEVSASSMLIEGSIPASGASLVVGAAKSGKTIMAVQMAIAVASGAPLYGRYRVLTPGPVLIVEQDDPAGRSSVKAILQRSSIPVDGIPFHLATGIQYQFGPALLEWLEGRISELSLRLIVLDSYITRPCGGLGRKAWTS